VKAHAIVSMSGKGRAALDRLLAAFREAPPAWVQLREKQLADRELLSLARDVRAALPAATALLVNGRPDVAVAAGAQGAQLPSDGLPARDVRRAFPSPFLIGVSCHAIGEIRAAAAEGADFALLAPIYAPASKPGDRREPLGPEALDALPDPAETAVHVLGGIRLDRIAAWPAERRRRVAAAAGISLFAEAEDPAGVVRALAALEAGG
jgi:thiamine-phosphate pyrophosphorylase